MWSLNQIRVALTLLICGIVLELSHYWFLTLPVLLGVGSVVYLNHATTTAAAISPRARVIRFIKQNLQVRAGRWGSGLEELG